MKKTKIKIFSIFFLGVILFLTSSILVKADPPIADHDITENSYLKQELIVYKCDDVSNEWDYYLVKLTFWEKYRDWDVWEEIWQTSIYINCLTSGAEALQTYAQPADKSFRVLETGVSVSYYGVRIDLWLPAGHTDMTLEDNNQKARWWNDAIMGGWGTVPLTRSSADCSIVFAVPEGAQFRVVANTAAYWWRWYVFVWVYSTAAWGTQCYCSYTP